MGITGDIKASLAKTLNKKKWLPCNGGHFDVEQYPQLSILLQSIGMEGDRVPDCTGCTLQMDSNIGQFGGSNSIVLNPTQLPAHHHWIAAKRDPKPTPGHISDGTLGATTYFSGSGEFGGGHTGSTGDGKPIPIVPRHICVTFYIHV